MSMAAAASYRTIPEGLVLGSLQAHFLLGSKPEVPFIYKVQRLSSGRRLSVRLVNVEHGGKVIATMTLMFVRKALADGPAMKHAVSRSSVQDMEDVTKDDLVPKSRWGPWMKFQRLTPEPEDAVPPQPKIAPAVAKIWSPISTPPGTIPQILGLINLTDYHILDAPLTLHGISYGLPDIGSPAEERSPGNRKTTKNNVKMNTSLNHAIHFHIHDGFRADDLTYIEVESPWARDGRAMLRSKIFSKDGLLIATCEQEGFYMLTDDAKSSVGNAFNREALKHIFGCEIQFLDDYNWDIQVLALKRMFLRYILANSYGSAGDGLVIHTIRYMSTWLRTHRNDPKTAEAYYVGKLCDLFFIPNKYLTPGHMLLSLKAKETDIEDPQYCVEYHKLSCAAFFGEIGLMQELLHGDFAARVRGLSMSFEYLLDIFGSPIVAAIRGGHMNAVLLLMCYRVVGTSYEYWSAIFNAMYDREEADVIPFLQLRAHIVWNGYPRFAWYRDILTIAASHGYTSIVELLFLEAFQRASQDWEREAVTQCVLFNSARRGHLDIVRMMVEAGVDVNYSSWDSTKSLRITPLYVAAMAGHTDVVTYLLKRGADISRSYRATGVFAFTGSWQNLVGYTLWMGHFETARVLIRHAQWLKIVHRTRLKDRRTFLVVPRGKTW
ncbi:hypothetical protein NA57DRAFT_57128 [Rhizodiscina lignyota]|uniref:Ankyrin repeat protein n=1 Tax=Rhizodiscina lignyota TaxID=1504668 RepID=A0A9P4I9Y8_9PEZI|nr:hypothetical protein NA57DRAFT_57128 [Rhizodiscina lignyota]